MQRRELLVGALCCWCLAACTTRRRPPTTPPSRSRPSGSDPRATSIAEGGAHLSVKPVVRVGELAAQSGHCDLDGVLAARGSGDLAASACARDLEIERDLADELAFDPGATRHAEGRIKHLAGDLAAARRDYEEAIREDGDGRDPGPVTDVARVNLGLLDYEEGDHTRAMEALRAVLEHSEDPATRGAAHHNLALVFLALGRTDAALDAVRTAHALLVGAMGETHASVGATLNTLGVIHGERDELDLAIEALDEAVEVRRASLGEHHPATAASLTNLGIALDRRGDHAAALIAHRRALAIDESVLGPDHAVTAADHGHVGAALFALGERASARASFVRALAILEPVRAADDPEVARLRQWIAATRPLAHR